ncbi:MAG: helix-turn-helix domain-containing protein, partial [Bradyrhizobium sp.]
MSIQAVGWALEQYIPTPIAKLVLVSLANHANHETGECWPKIETIARECSCSIRSVQRYVRVLEEKGLVKVEPRFIKGRQDSSLYWLQIPGASFQRREHGRGDRLA